MFKKLLEFLGAMGVIIVLSSCGSSKPTHFYLLNDIQTQFVKKSQQMHKGVIGIGPVTFPKYLNQPQIVTRSASNQLNLDEFNQWGEPLKDNFTRVLTQDVQHNLNAYYVSMYPWPLSQKITYQVFIDVNRFDANSQGKVICDVNYHIIKSATYERVVSKNKIYEDIIGTKLDYSRLAQSMSTIVSRIGRDVAQDIVQKMD